MFPICPFGVYHCVFTIGFRTSVGQAKVILINYLSPLQFTIVLGLELPIVLINYQQLRRAL